MLSIVFFVLPLIIVANCGDILKLDEVVTRKELDIGQRFLFMCSVFDGAKPIEFQWYRDNVSLKPKENLIIEKNVLETRLIIPSVATDDAGTYSCKAINSFGFDSKSTILIINGMSCLLLKQTEKRNGFFEIWEIISVIQVLE